MLSKSSDQLKKKHLKGISMSIASDLILQNCQVASLREMSRVLCVGGRALIYVWAKDQKKKEMSSYLKQNKKNREGGDSKESSNRERRVWTASSH